MDGMEFTRTGFFFWRKCYIYCAVLSIAHQWIGPGCNRALAAATPSEDLGPIIGSHLLL